MTEPSPKHQGDFPLDEQLEKAPQPNMSQAVAKPQKTRRSLYLLLGLVLGSVATLIALPYIPINIANQLRLPTLIVMEPKVSPPPITLPMVQDQKIVVESPEFDKKVLHKLQASIDVLQQRLNAVPSLNEGMQTLSNDVQALHQTQTSVRAAQVSIETMQLHSRLSWILHASSHLPQIRLAWEEIVLLPSLNDTQRQQASAMLALAEQRQMDVEHWQQALGRAMASYHLTPTSSHNLLGDWLPKEGRFAGVSDWISQQFHVQKATYQHREQLLFLQQLQSIQHNLDLEQWPDAKLWTLLRSRLQLHILHNDASQQALTLPENFSSIQSDIELLQQTARTWLKES